MNKVIKHLRQFDMANIASLYVGKISGVLVAFFFLPLYSRLLGSDQFGLVAIVFSLQALLLMLDLGMSTMVSREIAAGVAQPSQLVRLVKTAGGSLSSFYLLLIIVVFIFHLFVGLNSIGIYTVLGCVILLWLLVLQNLYYCALLAQGFYQTATWIQAIGVLTRALASTVVLEGYSATFSAFVLVQLIFSAVHCIISRYYSYRALTGNGGNIDNAQVTITECFELIKRGRALLASGIAGAIAMQFDKPIISFFMTARDVSPYFLAVTLSSAPVGLLAAPIVQYFQPKIISDLAGENLESCKKNIKKFSGLVALFCLLPSIILYIFNEVIVSIWLHGAAMSSVVSEYSRILLLAYAFGAVSYVPYVLIIAKSDYKFQARLSVFGTIVVVTLTSFAAYQKNIDLVCYAYVVYFAITAIGFICRVVKDGLKVQYKF